MIDRNLLLKDFEGTARRLGRKGVDPEVLAEVRRLVEERNQRITDESSLRASLNKASRAIGQLMREGRRDEAEAAKAEVGDLKEQIGSNAERLRLAEERIEHLLLRIPNLPSDDAPDGKGEDDNVILRTVGYQASDYEGKTFRPHWEIGEELGIYDPGRGAKLAGNMFVVLRGDGARLLRALAAYALARNQGVYEEILPPTFVRTDIFTGTGQLPKFADDAYKIEDLDLWAIPTGEVPLMGLHFDEILEEESLPRRYMAQTPCFRREAGSAGKDTRGLQRLHEFHKVELVKLCTREQVPEEFEGLLASAEGAIADLGLPYRVVDLCAGDLTFASERVHDLEVYAPGVGRWLEVSSVGRFGDYQTRRSRIRYRPAEGGKPRLCHAMNGSGLATPRVWAALLEHGLQPDGRVRLPEALVPYMGKPYVEPAQGSREQQRAESHRA